MTSRPGSFTGKSRSINWSIKVKIAVLAPMPSARERIATAANRGLRRIARRANRKSRTRLVITLIRRSPVPVSRKTLQPCELFFVVLRGQAGHHRKILERRHVARHGVRSDDFAQQTAHDFPAAGLRQRVRKT